MARIKSECRFCRYFTLKRRLLRSSFDYCTKFSKEVKWDGVCKDYIGDPQKIAYKAGFRTHEREDGGAYCGQCSFCGVGQNALGQRVRVCTMFDFVFDTQFRSMEYVCDYYKDGGLEASIRDLADSIVKDKRK